jgi:hypothetical protein
VRGFIGDIPGGDPFIVVVNRFTECEMKSILAHEYTHYYYIMRGWREKGARKADRDEEKHALIIGYIYCTVFCGDCSALISGEDH